MGDPCFSATFLRIHALGAPEGSSNRSLLTSESGAVSAASVEQILHYMIQARLGEGGMGIVYKAIDQKLNRPVALKFLPFETDRSPADVQRLLQEANALSALNHRHIATIYSVETAGEQHFLVLEYLPGGTLKAKVQQTYRSGRKFSIEEALRYAEQTAEGLAHAHAQGIIHRDVKTSNLMLTAGGDVKITDFGVAKLSGSSMKTIPGSLLGTIAYMSPEQALGQDVDHRSDVFSLGTVLFELLTGQLPFDAANDAALLTKVANARVPELNAFRTDLPSEAQWIVEKALKKRLEDRYSTMGEMLADLRVARGCHSSQTRSISPNERQLTVASRRRRWRLGAVAAAGGLALVAAIIFARHRPVEGTSPTNASSSMAAGELAANRLVVLPLTMVKDDKGNENSHEKLSDSHEELIKELNGELGKLKDPLRSFAVVPVIEVLKKNVTNLREAKEIPHATLLLTASVIRDDGLIVTANLFDVRKQILVNSIDFEISTSLPRDFAERVTRMLHEYFSGGNYLRGRGYLQRYDRVENLRAAIAAFDKALTENSSSAEAYAGRAEAYLRMYRQIKNQDFLQQARRDIEAALKHNDGLASAHFARGLLLDATGDHKGAIKSYSRSLEIERGADATREQANSYDALNDLERAQDAYRDAIRMRRGYWLGYKDLGVFYQRHGRLDEALPLFKRVVELAPDDYSSHTNLGGTYLKLKKYVEATEAYKRAVAIDPDPLAYYSLGTSLYDTQYYRDAVDAYRKSVDLNPKDATYWGALGDAYSFVPGIADRAAEAYQTAVSLALKEEKLLINSRDARLPANIATWLTLTDKRRARKEIDRALRLNPRDALVQAKAASVYEQLGLRDKALDAVEAALKLGYAIVEIENWPRLEMLRQDPRYKRIVATVKAGTDKGK